MKIVILAGGVGTRLWPVSRKNFPKQIKPLLGKESLLKATVKRLLAGFKKQDIFLSTNLKQSGLIKKDLQGLILESNYIIEPEKKDTAPAIGLATMLIAKKNPNEIIAIVNSDHFIKNTQGFCASLATAGKAAEKFNNHLVLIGVRPKYPETGYGYIKMGKRAAKVSSEQIFSSLGFKEKPDLKTAQAYLKSGNYLWNPAYFVFRADLMLDLFKQYLPKHYALLKKIRQEPKNLKKYFSQMPTISIDYGIMEKAGKMLVLPAKFDWADVGHFRTVYEALVKNKEENVTKGINFLADSFGNLIYNYTDQLIAGIGLRDMIVVNTPDAILVCSKADAQKVKQLVKAMLAKNLGRYL